MPSSAFSQDLEGRDFTSRLPWSPQPGKACANPNTHLPAHCTSGGGRERGGEQEGGRIILVFSTKVFTKWSEEEAPLEGD